MATTISPPLYEYSIVPFNRSMKNLLQIMTKAEKHAAEKGENVDDYLKLQIYSDMKCFDYQIQRATDTAKFVVVRVGEIDASTVSMEDNETTWSQLKERLKKTVKVLDDAKAEDFVGKEQNEISIFGGKYKFTGMSYLQNYALPNFYFHVTTAYDLLRMKGVPIGKMDFLMGADAPAA